MLFSWGAFVHRHRLWVLAASAAVLVVALLGLSRGGTLSSSNGAVSSFPSQRAADLINQELTSNQPRNGSSFLLILRSRTLKASSPAFEAQIEQAVEPLRSDSRVADFVLPSSLPAAQRQALTSKDGHAVLVEVNLHAGVDHAAGFYPGMVGEVQRAEPSLEITGTGQVPIESAINRTLDSDLRRAETLSLPITLILLVIIFGSVVAAGLPLAVGLLSIAGGVGGTFLLSHATTVSQYALNIVTLIGLGVSIDYSLFIVTRFREELATGATDEEALSTAVGTAGRAVAFSGMTVAIGLGALLLFPGTYLTSMGAAGMLVVAVAVFFALTFLPAMLSLLGRRVGWLAVPLLRRRSTGGFWLWVGNTVMRRPVMVLVPTLTVLLVAGIPFLQLRMASGGIDQLPASSPTRVAYAQLTRDFPNESGTEFQVVVRWSGGASLSSAHVAELYDLSRRMARIKGVSSVSGPLNLSSTFTEQDYQRLYATPEASLPADVRQVVRGSVGAHIVVLTATTPDDSTSQGAENVLGDLKAMHVSGGQVLVTGETAASEDIVNFVESHVPGAMGFVVGVTLLVLFLLTGSVLLPLKAVLSNLISICASFGAMVFIFQEGHLASQLGFTPQPLDPSIPVLLFVMIFGLSMDYEVLLVTRIQEQYRLTGDNDRAVVIGLARSGGLITGAAAIMVTVFIAFATSQIMLIKALGTGLSLAVVLDATLLRGLVVPSVMRLLGRANWWAPAFVHRLHDRLGLAEGESPHRRQRVSPERRFQLLLLGTAYLIARRPGAVPDTVRRQVHDAVRAYLSGQGPRVAAATGREQTPPEAVLAGSLGEDAGG